MKIKEESGMKDVLSVFLENFITEKDDKLREAKDAVLTKLTQKKKSKKKKMKMKMEGVPAQSPDHAKTVMFIQKCTPEKLMGMVLLNKKVLKEDYSSPDASVKQKAMYHFAKHEGVKAEILAFREQYPKWKKAKHLLSQVAENKDILGELTNVMMEQNEVEKKTEENGVGKMREENGVNMSSKKRWKKKMKASKRKSSKRKQEAMVNNDDESADDEPQNKKLKAVANGISSNGKQDFSSVSSYSNDIIGTSPPKKDDKQKPSLLRPDWLINPQKQPPMPPTSSNGQNLFTKIRPTNRRGISGKPTKGLNRNERGNPNMIMVSNDWKNKLAAVNNENDAAAPTSSLLRPAWLTNPEEHKPPVKKAKPKPLQVVKKKQWNDKPSRGFKNYKDKSRRKR